MIQHIPANLALEPAHCAVRVDLPFAVDLRLGRDGKRQIVHGLGLLVERRFIEVTWLGVLVLGRVVPALLLRVLLLEDADLIENFGAFRVRFLLQRVVFARSAPLGRGFVVGWVDVLGGCLRGVEFINVLYT